MAGDVYDVGPLSASSVGLDIGVGLVEASLVCKPLELREMSEVASVVNEVLASLLAPGGGSALSLSWSGWGSPSSLFLA